MNTWTEPEARHRPQRSLGASQVHRRPRRTWGQRLLISLGAITSVGLLLVAGVLYWLLQRYEAISFVNVPDVEAAAPGEPSNWLLVGSDSREGISEDDPDAAVFLNGEYAGKRTDTIIIARIDPGSQTVDLLSIPRDLWVTIASSGAEGRINSAFAGDDGPQNLVATVEDTLDIDINNYAEVNFVGFRDVVDALGGVPLYFDSPVRDQNSGLFIEEAGCHMLDGTQALAFARSRYLQYQDEDGDWRGADATSDLGRNSRQQFLLSRMADRASSQIGFTDFGTIDAIIRAGGENLLVDDGSGAGDLIGLARSFSGVGGEGVRFHTLPVSDFTTSGGAQVLDLNEDEAQPTLEVFRGILPPPDPTAFPSAEGADRATFTVQVLNGAGIGGLAGETTTSLEELDFQLTEPADAGELVDETVIRYPPGSESAATELGRVLTVTPMFEVDSTVSEVTLVVGPDFDGVTDASVAGVTVSTTPSEEPVPAEDTTKNLVGFFPGPGPEGTECAF